MVNLEDKANEKSQRRDDRLCNSLGYFGLGLLGASAIDVAHTYLTNYPVVSYMLGVNAPKQEYFMDAMLFGIGLFVTYEAREIKKIIKKERISKE